MDNAPTYSQDHLDLIVAQAIRDERTRIADLLEERAATSSAAHVAWIHDTYPRWRKGEPYDAFKRRFHSFREEDVERATRTETLFDAAIALRQENL